MVVLESSTRFVELDFDENPELFLEIQRNRRISEELDRQFRPRLIRYFLTSGLSQDEAENLTQDTFVKMLAALRRFQPQEGVFSHWVSRIAANLLRNYKRSLARSRISSVEEEVFLNFPQTSRNEEQPEFVVEHEEESTKLYEALLSLSPVDRALVILTSLGLSHQEAMERFGFPSEGASKSRKVRSMRKLKEMLEPHR